MLVIAGKPSAFAQVLLTAPAVDAFSARMAQPCYADSLAERKSLRSCPEPIYYPHDLMSRNNRMSRKRQLTFDNVKVRAADAAGPYPDPDFSRAGEGSGSSIHLRGADSTGAHSFKHHRFHDFPLLQRKLIAG